MSQKRIVLGVDGGGTKTVCVALPLQMQPTCAEIAPVNPLARVEVGSTNWNSVGTQIARENLQAAFTDTLAQAGYRNHDVGAVCLGMSGVDRPEDRARIDSWLSELLPGIPAIAENDAVIALASGTGGHLYGIVVVSGTGMIALGFDAQGKRCRAGGWGALLGDGGSGYAIGAAVLRAVTHAADGSGPKTGLTDHVLTDLKLPNVEALVRWTYDDISWQRIAALAPLASQAAHNGDAEALFIVHTAAKELAIAVEAVARCLKLEETFPLVLAGGGLREGFLPDQLRDRLRRTLPHAQHMTPTVEPAVGAALLALTVIEEQ